MFMSHTSVLVAWQRSLSFAAYFSRLQFSQFLYAVIPREDVHIKYVPQELSAQNDVTLASLQHIKVFLIKSSSSYPDQDMQAILKKKYNKYKIKARLASMRLKTKLMVLRMTSPDMFIKMFCGFLSIKSACSKFTIHLDAKIFMAVSIS